MRLAWFSPMPPVRSGIATCSAELVAALRPQHTIDVYVDEPLAKLAPAAAELRSAHDFVWRHRQAPYDLTIYQLGNSSHHDYQWPYLFRFPGLVVLHDAHLHHARAASLLRQRRAADYRAEFAASEPAASLDAAEVAIAGFDSTLLYAWPFTRLVVSASRLTAVHTRTLRDDLRRQHPDAAIEHVHLGHGTPLTPADAAERRSRRRRELAIPDDAVVIGCFGGLTPEKRVPQILDAFAWLQPSAPGTRLLLAGPPASHYDVTAAIAARGLDRTALVTGYVDADDAFTDCIAACDVALNLRWPTAREVSGPWLRALAAGLPTVVVDLAHLADVPTLDPRTWRSTSTTAAAPVAVAIDIVDEDHSLRLAMRRLAADAPLRRSLGAAARRYWETEHAQAVMVDDYRRLLPVAASRPQPSPALPRHLDDDGSSGLTAVLSGMGVAMPWSKI